MFDHITIRASDRTAAESFYETVLRTVGVGRSGREEQYKVWGGDFSLATADDRNRVTRRLHIGFVAPSRVHVDAFWQAGVGAAYRSDGEPGPRPEYSPDYYGGFLLDPDGNSAQAVHGSWTGPPGVLDHLWIRVADVAAARAFYATIAPFAGLRHGTDRPERAQFRTAGSSFSLVPGSEPTVNAHIAFGAADDATVEAFHAAAVAAGHRDNGAPGERAVYHPGYYGAFVCDPDGNNIEVVNHNRA